MGGQNELRGLLREARQNMRLRGESWWKSIKKSQVILGETKEDRSGVRIWGGKKEHGIGKSNPLKGTEAFRAEQYESTVVNHETERKGRLEIIWGK